MAIAVLVCGSEKLALRNAAAMHTRNPMKQFFTYQSMSTTRAPAAAASRYY